MNEDVLVGIPTLLLGLRLGLIAKNFTQCGFVP